MKPAYCFTIGSLASAAGVGVETIRFYQRSGLLSEPVKPANGIRRYGESDLQQLRFIVRSKRLGFSLAEIHDLMNLANDDVEARRELARHKLDLIESRIADLQEIADSLRRILDECDAPASQCACALGAAASCSTQIEGS